MAKSEGVQQDLISPQNSVLFFFFNFSWECGLQPNAVQESKDLDVWATHRRRCRRRW